MIASEKMSEIQNALHQESVGSILQHCGYELYRGYKFKLRVDERTPSASIRNDGYIVDFGGDFKGDIIDLLREYHGLSFKESVQYVATCLGVQL